MAAVERSRKTVQCPQVVCTKVPRSSPNVERGMSRESSALRPRRVQVRETTKRSKKNRESHPHGKP